MKTKKLIINRMSDWYSVTSVNSDPFYVAITILEKLSNRSKIGVKYNRQDISADIMQQTNEEVIQTIDKAIVLLISRQLITLENYKGNKILMITDSGYSALNQFKEELVHVD